MSIPQYIASKGLPNLGNTCYINAILQFLYSSEEFRQRVEQSSQKTNEFSLTSRIRNIFASMKDGQIRNQCSLLRKLIQKIQQIQSRIDCYRQQDVFQILMLILNQLFDQNQGLQALFTIEIENSCKCGNYTTNNLFVMGTDRTCFECHEQIKLKVLRESRLLIVSNSNQNANNSQGSLIKDFNNHQLRYKCIAKIFYIGNGQIGHYRASRRLSGNIFIEFCDSHGYIQQDSNPLYQLYQKTQVKSFFSQIKEDNFAIIDQVYCSKLHLVYKITASKVIKRQRKIYFFFKQTQVQNGFQLQMNILNYQEQIGLKQRYFYQKLYHRKDLKYNAQFFISSFLKQNQFQINRRIYSFLRKGSDQKKNAFTKLFYESSKAQNDRFRHLPFIEVIRNQ